MSTAAVVLAAGASRRLGRPKQTVELLGETLLARAVRVAYEAGMKPVIVVTRTQLEFELPAEDVTIVTNPDPDEGISSSIRCGIRAARQHDIDGALLMTCDQPGVRPEHLRSLCEIRREPAGSAYAGRIGVPAYFPASYFEELLTLSGDRGARELLQRARAVMAEEVAIDIDTEEDVATAKRLFGRET